MNMPAQRDVARALLFDDEGRLLMLHWRDPVTGHDFLEPPGGALESGETFQETLRREIAEESGITQVDVGDFVTEIDHAFTFAEEGYDRRFVGSIARHDPGLNRVGQFRHKTG